MKYSNADPHRHQYDNIHPPLNKFRFIIGGKQFAYPGFNGQVTKVYLGVGRGAFIDSLEELGAWMDSQAKIPRADMDRVVTLKQVKEAELIEVGKGAETYKEIGGGSDTSFADEYSVSGWFRWVPPAK
jgi:hypothetical protein